MAQEPELVLKATSCGRTREPDVDGSALGKGAGGRPRVVIRLAADLGRFWTHSDLESVAACQLDDDDITRARPEWWQLVHVPRLRHHTSTVLRKRTHGARDGLEGLIPAGKGTAEPTLPGPRQV